MTCVGTPGKINLPELICKKPGVTVRAASLVSSGIKLVSDQVQPYTEFWNQANQDLVSRSVDPTQLGKNLLIVIGDSSALGVGASQPELGFVSPVRDFLVQVTGEGCELVVLAHSGARVANGIEQFLPTALEVREYWEAHKHGTVWLISCIGSNDIFWTLSLAKLQRQLTDLVKSLPARSLVATLAGASPRAFASNAHLKKITNDNNMRIVEPWRNKISGALDRIAEDKFHPSDYGYQCMADAFCEALDKEMVL